MWTEDTQIEITPNGRRALNRAKDARELQPEDTDIAPEPDAPIGSLEPHLATCRQCNQNSSLYLIVEAIDDYTRAWGGERS